MPAPQAVRTVVQMPRQMGRMADRASLRRAYRQGRMHAAGRPLPRAGQAIIEYTILLVALATIAVGVLFLAGNSLALAFNDVTYDVVHSSDPAPVTVSPHTCSDGTTAVFRHSKWRCKDE